MFPADHWWLPPLLIFTFIALASTGALMCGRGFVVPAVSRGKCEDRQCKPARLRVLAEPGQVTLAWPLAAALAIVASAGCAWTAAVPMVAEPSSSSMLAVHSAFLGDLSGTAATASAVVAIDSGHGAATADRDWNRLEPVFRDRLERVIDRLGRRGYRFQLIEGYRTPERQEQLLAMPVRVTYAGAWQSRHQFGLAADLAPISAGRVLVSADSEEALGAYKALGEEAEAAGLTWGGRWTLRDYGHVELAVPTSREVRG